MNQKMVGPSMLALVGDMTGPTYWRVLAPFTALEKSGYHCGWDLNQNPLIGTIAHAFNGYLMPRMSWRPEDRRMAEQWFQSVRSAGKFVVYDADDDVFSQAETHRRIELNWTDGKSFERLEQERFERIWALQQADGCTVSTQRLATIVRSYTDRPVVVCANAIDLPWFRGIVRATKRQTPGLTIGWAGGRRHDRDVEMMAEAWGRIAYRYPAVTFVVQGWQPAVIKEHVTADRLVTLPWMPLETYPAGLREVDIACCSAADTPFNRPKSAIKCYEAAAAGSAVVASPTLYAGTVDHGFSGFIAESVGEWEDALSELIEHHALRRMMARRLLKTVEKHHSLARNLWRWPAAWQAIQASAVGRRLVAV